MKKRTLVLSTLALIALSGCAIKYDNGTRDYSNEFTPGNATVTFYNSRILTLAIPTSPILYLNENNELVPVALGMSPLKVRHEVSPGKHTYMISGKTAAFITVNAEANKHYYIKLKNEIGYFGGASRTTVTPYTAEDLQDESLKRTIKHAPLQSLDEDASRWFEANKEKLQQKFNEGINKYRKEVEQGIKTEVKSEDGIDELF